jgi:hypothetical protein
MEDLFKAAISRKLKIKTQSGPFAYSGQSLFFLIMLLVTFLFTACKKYPATEPNIEEQAKSARTNSANQEFINSKAALPAQTIAELSQVREATANLRDTFAARAAGYANTGIELPNMGLHFVNEGFLGDGEFNLSKPDFLVFNKNPNGKFELVAVEFAVPIDARHPDEAHPPTGFTGDADVWDFRTLGLPLWTLHAWIWKTNPDGVFKMMNPIVP